MAWFGWMQLAGTEVVNAERTAQYVRKNLPGLTFTNRYDSAALPLALALQTEGVNEFTEDPVYESPLIDRPDWIDLDDPDSLDFYGFYPLSVEGLEDSTGEVTITQQVGDGAVHSRPRATHREVRFTGLLVGVTEAAIDTGMVWLRKALAGSACAGDNCEGDTLCYLFQAPDVCCDDVTPDDVDDVRACLARQQRQLHDVVLIDGPAVQERYTPRIGAVRRVEFILSAGDPHIWGLPADVPPPATVVHEVAGGTRAAPLVLPTDRTNLLTSPSFGGGVTGGAPTGWSAAATAGVATLTRYNAEGLDGALGLGRAQFTNLPAGGTGTVLSEDVPAGPGQTWTASIYVRGREGGKARMGLRWYSGGETALSDTLGPVTDLSPGWNRISVTGTAPAGTVEVNAIVQITELPLTRQNKATNPSAGSVVWNAPVWGTGTPTPTGTITRVTGDITGWANDDNTFTRMQWTVGAQSGGGIGGVGTENTNLPVGAGEAFSGSVMVRTNTPTWLQMEMGGWRGTPVQCLPGVWTKLTVTGTVTAAGGLSPRVIPAPLAPTPTWKAGNRLDVDALLVETGPSLDPMGSFFDGRTRGAAWDGLAHRSTSTLAPYVEVAQALLEQSPVLGEAFHGSTTSTQFHRYAWTGAASASTSIRQPIAHYEVDCAQPAQGMLVDPGLPVVPAAPRPPAITPQGIFPVTQWHRRVFTIPANLIPTWSDAVPVVRLDNTGGPDLRMVRLRFYSSPFGFEVRRLPPCDFCGDFLISYLPGNSVFTLDGQNQRATVTMLDGQEVAANHVLYGTGGQPFQWPLLSCGTLYHMTMDTPRGETVPGAPPTLTASLQIVGRS